MDNGDIADSFARVGILLARHYDLGMGKLDPIISEFDTEEEAAAYDLWFREQVEAGLNSTSPRIPHEEVKKRTRALLEKHRLAQSRLGR